MNEKSKYEHQVFKNDPVYFRSLLDKYVEVKTSDECSYKGFLYSIDPVSESVILSIPSPQGYVTKIVMGHTIKTLMLFDNTEKFAPPIRRLEEVHISNEKEQSERKVQLLNWLSKNMLPVKEVNKVIEVHQGALKIFPPYQKQNCYSDNSIILGRIQHLLQNMPNT